MCVTLLFVFFNAGACDWLENMKLLIQLVIRWLEKLSFYVLSGHVGPAAQLLLSFQNLVIQLHFPPQMQKPPSVRPD